MYLYNDEDNKIHIYPDKDKDKYTLVRVNVK